MQAVPLTVVNDKFAVPGMIPEEQFVEIVVKAAEDSDAAPAAAGGPTNADRGTAVATRGARQRAPQRAVHTLARQQSAGTSAP